MYSNGINLSASSYQSTFASSSGKLTVPVKPSAVIYSQFDYVHGTPAGSGQRGVPLNKVRILNTLIDQLVSMRKKEPTPEGDFVGMTEDQKDELIKQFQNDIKVAINLASQPQTYGFAGLMPQAGAVVSVTA